ncbi:chemotaxis protein CheR [Rhizocola hellebori]|uniref:protein-glutamate O-methyltransferase n=1 Tax=Rhizocola hellebori TaxID=1392758 RepID=A0A8J3VEQ9_9ACTN|nr:CheR family methyltransferase [Rhizocola hellebori]GIH03552.1 chemotaxis protein CheR [Rhizocola hellebori]
MTPIDPHFEALLEYLKEARGFDFTGYKRTSLMRRVSQRMATVGVTGYPQYVEYLEVQPDEFTALFNTILINVTGFFRDAEAWDYLQKEILTPLIEQKPTTAPIRVWSAGCASGEEAYTLAIVLAEMLGLDEFRRRVKIYATDVDDEALAQARQGAYSERAVRSLPQEILDKYFEVQANHYVFHKDMRRSVIFGRNDLVQDAPISRVDLLVCRNTLMYFNSETQSRILTRFHFAVAEGGVLFLGRAEMLLSHTNLFLPVDLKRRVFRRVTRLASQGAGTYYTEPTTHGQRGNQGVLDHLRNEAFLASPVAQIVVTSDGLVALTNRRAETLFGVSTKDIGRPFRDLDVSYRPVELRRYIEQVQMERRMVRLADVELARPGSDTLCLEIQVNPLPARDSSLLGVALIFHDVTTARRLHEELEHTNGQLETAYEELQSTNEALETTNEELQSTVEELETTNEELQSTNEELETINEELQSTNDELRHINDQLQHNTQKLDSANAFLEAILTSLRAGVAVLNRDMHVQIWNRRAEDLWGLRREEAVGQHFLNLDIGLPTEQLRSVIKQVLGGAEQQEMYLPAINRRGRNIMVRVVCTSLASDNDTPSGAVMVMEPEFTAEPKL